ncbi:hypothetical protein RhiirB3_392357 [Rhizophagus irregularis]|nr:hypothetical protein RhiirB3_392349 [Rhizophagus irregularis]PKY30169.1 hypothetical protein RhiirB3_392357 [Rhizophagus irregularis]
MYSILKVGDETTNPKHGIRKAKGVPSKPFCIPVCSLFVVERLDGQGPAVLLRVGLGAVLLLIIVGVTCFHGRGRITGLVKFSGTRRLGKFRVRCLRCLRLKFLRGKIRFFSCDTSYPPKVPDRM